MSTIAFPVAFLVTSLLTVVFQSWHDTPLALDGVMLSVLIALLVWPAHALTMRYLRRRETEPVPHLLVSVVAGVVSVGAVYPFKAVVNDNTWGIVKVGFPLMYWFVAVLATWIAFRFLRAGRSRSHDSMGT